MRGLDPRIHLLRKKFFARKGWIAGSSRAMTTLIYRPCAFAGTSGREGRTGAHACRARVMMDLRARGGYHGDRAMHGITTLQHMPKRAAAALAIASTLAAGVAGGFAARYVHLPLPWLLGALFTTMALSLAGAPVRLIP